MMSPSGPISDPKSRDIREAIVKATDLLLARFGYKKMTIEDVARQAGIGKGTVYLHFPSKEEVALSTIDGLVDRVIAKLDSIASGPGSEAERLSAMLLARIMERFDGVQHYTETLEEMLLQLRPAILERRRAYFEREAAVLSRVIAEGKRRDVFQVRSAVGQARTLIVATNALLPFDLSAPQLVRRGELIRTAKSVIALVIRGLEATGSRAKTSGGSYA